MPIIDVEVMLQVANLYLAIGDVEECNHTCQVLLRIDKNNDAATLVRINNTASRLLSG